MLPTNIMDGTVTQVDEGVAKQHLQCDSSDKKSWQKKSPTFQ